MMTKSKKGMRRRCPRCERYFETSSSSCPGCHNKYQKAYYKKNPESIRKSTKRQRAAVRQTIIKAKAKPCMDCHSLFPWYVMDFDHVKGVKKFSLAEAAQKYRSIRMVQSEIDKCDVVCSNCHRIRTWKRASSSEVV